MTRDRRNNGLSVTLARVEEQLKALSAKLDSFMLSALSPDTGFVTRSEMKVALNLADSERRNLRDRLNEINRDHNERLQRLEQSWSEHDGELQQAVQNMQRQLAYGIGVASGIGSAVAIAVHFLGKL